MQNTSPAKIYEVNLLVNFVGTNESWTEEQILISRECTQLTNDVDFRGNYV